jgi:hypothetical protein
MHLLVATLLAAAVSDDAPAASPPVEAERQHDAHKPAPAHKPITLAAPGDSQLTLAGYLETYYNYNFGRPSNGINNFRAFDNRHGAITLQNLALDASWAAPRAYARLALQVGQAPATYYGVSEPSQPGSDGAAASDAVLLRAIQQSYLGFRPSRRLPIFIEAGVFLSSIGIDSLAIRDNWHWSHSPLYFALPFYHSGIHIGFQPAPAHTLKLALYNGWNNILDNNRQKSIGLLYSFEAPRLALGAVYMTGVERPTGAPEGAPWRHLFNVYLKGAPLRRLGLLGDLNGGLEPNTFGLSGWFAASGAARVELYRWLFLAARGSWVREQRGEGASGVAAPILLPYASDDPTQWFAAGTFTLDLRPVPDHIAIKLELRHDRARQPAFFRGQIDAEGLANARAQSTLTLGLHAWF